MNLTVNNYLGGTMNGFSTATINTRNTGISKSSSFSTGKSTKKSLNYNAKQISSQLIRATKSRTAAAVLTKAKKVQSIIYSTASEPGNMMTVRYRLPSHTQKEW